MQRYKILMFTMLWKRPQIAEICFMGIDRLRRLDVMDIESFAVISEESMIPLCERYGVHWVMHENLPLGAKKNCGLSEAIKLEWSYLVEIGSDDLLKDEYLHALMNGIKTGGDLFGIREFYYLNSENGDVRLNRTRTSYGIGRAISRRVFEKLPRLWTNQKNCGLDNDSMFRMAGAGFLEKKLNAPIPLGVDVKSDVNLWPFNYLQGTEASTEDALSGLSVEEVDAIKALSYATV